MQSAKKIRTPDLLYSDVTLIQVDQDPGSGALLRLSRDLVAEIVADALAKIKADAAGTLVLASVKSRLAVLKSSRQIRSTYSYSGILDAEYAGLIHIDLDPAFIRIFDRI